VPPLKPSVDIIRKIVYKDLAINQAFVPGNGDFRILAKITVNPKLLPGPGIGVPFRSLGKDHPAVAKFPGQVPDIKA
jgi:hypothetical protein